MYLGDFAPDATIDFKFTTLDASGVPATLSGSPVVSLYSGNGSTESATGVTLTADFDSRTGLNHVRIVGSTASLVNGTDYHAIITTGTVGGSSVVGYIVAHFSVFNRSTSAAVYFGSVTGSATTTGFADSGLPTRDDNNWRGRIIIFLSGNLTGQARDITLYTNSSKTFTTSAWTQAPATSDRYAIF